MQISRKPVHRPGHGTTILVEAGNKQFNVETTDRGARAMVVAMRVGEKSSSYEYFLELNTEEILKCLMRCPPDTISDALRVLRSKLKDKRLEELETKTLPELHRQLALGAFGEARTLFS